MMQYKALVREVIVGCVTVNKSQTNTNGHTFQMTWFRDFHGKRKLSIHTGMHEWAPSTSCSQQKQLVANASDQERRMVWPSG